ncbi:hypothetical protein LXA43DRAFT_877016 [Ganoderma leucocontextum]|nr:hypothetical protein LXA43DRAFT_877016 [Ganoderma leucocontextum]
MAALRAFPRALFSESELEGCRWFALSNGVSWLPSVKTVQRKHKTITDIAGSQPRQFKSRMGNLYSMTSLAVMLAHEFANPLVMAYLQTLPEKAGETLGECTQGERWLSEVDPDLAGPMARAPDGRDYFVNKLAMAVINPGGPPTPVMIQRWFRRGGSVWAAAHPTRAAEVPGRLIVDEREGKSFDIPLTSMRYCIEDLLKPPPEAAACLPSPDVVMAVLVDDEKPLIPWAFPVRNHWRSIAKGIRVVGCPLWLYCDDTSGNTSKKWNKHNSLLFTLAGLPRALVHLMYNIHYMATSNIAPPLEMMEELVEQLCAARKEGIRVWDVQAQEYVLAIPWVLAFLGDNPMSSEFASHIGMQGKCFCRKCKVNAADTTENRAERDRGDKERLKEFLDDTTETRSKEDTLRSLNAQLERALGGAPSGVDKMATDTGVKDKYFTHYVTKLQEAVNAARERQKTRAPQGMSKTEEVRQTLQEVCATFPENIFNPVLHIPDFDPNTDTPFEALHVVLLGAVKYFWRDAVARQTSTSRETLIARLNSVLPTGLGIPRIRGETLVNYAGSLVGRDFRTILQVAPAVLYDLLPVEAYEAWLALCRLAPLIFQPEIHDLSAYEIRLKNAIDDFLAATALWSTQWFNKPKFHLFSYNFLIRLRSVLSNRQAPSTDIAEAFSLLHATRHLVSGGVVYVEDERTGKKNWRQAGEGVRALMNDKVFRHLMGMDGILNGDVIGRCLESNGKPWILTLQHHIPFSDSRTAHAGFSQFSALSPQVLNCEGLYLENGDLMRHSGWVVYRSPSSHDVRIGRIDEILLRAPDGAPLGALICKSDVGSEAKMPYRLPLVTASEGQYEFVSVLVRLSATSHALHVFHNCTDHRCKLSQTKTVMQERCETSLHRYEIQHDNPGDLILNLAQLTNSAILTLFRPSDRYPGLSREDLVEKAIANRVRLTAEAEQKKIEAEQKKADTARKKAEAAQKKHERTMKKTALRGGHTDGVGEMGDVDAQRGPPGSHTRELEADHGVPERKSLNHTSCKDQRLTDGLFRTQHEAAKSTNNQG